MQTQGPQEVLVVNANLENVTPLILIVSAEDPVTILGKVAA